MQIVTMLLASYGLCFAMMNDKIPFVPGVLRRLPLFTNEDGATFFTRMLRCPFCTGFHSGWLTWCLFNLRGQEFQIGHGLGMLAFAFASSAFCYLADIAAQKLED